MRNARHISTTGDTVDPEVKTYWDCPSASSVPSVVESFRRHHVVT